MKLRTKIYLLALVPALCIGIVTVCMFANKMKTSITQQAYKGMEAATILINSIFDASSTGEYHLNDNGEFYKGDTLNISEATDIVDQVKKDTGFDVTIFYGDTRYLTTIMNSSGERQVGTKASDAVIESVLNKGNNYSSDNVEIFETRYICYYIPLRQVGSEEVIGMIFLGERYEEVSSLIKTSIYESAIPCLILLIIAMLLAVKVGKDIVDSMQKGIAYLTKVKDGQLGFKVDETLLKKKDVVGDMCRSINQLNNKLSEIIENIVVQCQSLNENSSACNLTADRLNDSISQISAVVEQVAATTTNQAEDTEDVNKNISTMGDVITDISKMSHSAQDVLRQLTESMKEVENAVMTISNQTTQTHNSVEKITTATDMISNIAFQTKLLSLNANIEAARAGELGKGFAVVATEIQQLAQSSEEVTQQIQGILMELCENSEEALHCMDDVKEIVHQQHEQVTKTQDTFTELNLAIGGDEDYEVLDNGKTSLSTERRKSVETIHNLAAASEEIAASTEETAASVEQVAEMSLNVGEQAEHLKKIADVLREQVSHFHVEKEA